MVSANVTVKIKRRAHLSGKVRIVIEIDTDTAAEFTAARDLANEMEEHEADMAEVIGIRLTEKMEREGWLR